MGAGYVTRTMNRDEVALAIEWAAEEGWNPGLHDADTFRAADPRGFFVGTLNGEAVAAISVVKYEPGFAFLGLYIVRPEWRGRGLGWALWQHGMASAAGRQVGLDGVVAQQANYRKSGFELAWRNVRYEGRGGTSAPKDARVADLAGVPLGTVCAFDNAYFPAERAAFLRSWLTQPDAAARGWIEDGRLQGYGLVRRCRSGWKVGPCSRNGNISRRDCSSHCAPRRAPRNPSISICRRSMQPQWRWRSATTCASFSRLRACTRANHWP
jgi:ribosomal protein S18 acetylase RimI-like enzyme